MISSLEVLESVREVLEATKTRLQEKGWIQGTMGPRFGPNCLLGALHLTAMDWQRKQGEVVPYGSTMNALLTVLPRNSGNRRTGVDNRLMIYNDTPGRTEQEIYDLLDRAIKNVINQMNQM